MPECICQLSRERKLASQREVYREWFTLHQVVAGNVMHNYLYMPGPLLHCRCRAGASYFRLVRPFLKLGTLRSLLRPRLGQNATRTCIVSSVAGVVVAHAL